MLRLVISFALLFLTAGCAADNGIPKGYMRAQIMYEYDGVLRKIDQIVPCGTSILENPTRNSNWSELSFYFDTVFDDGHAVRVTLYGHLSRCPKKPRNSVDKNLKRVFFDVSIVDDIDLPTILTEFSYSSRIRESLGLIKSFSFNPGVDEGVRTQKNLSEYFDKRLEPLSHEYVTNSAKRFLRRACVFITARAYWQRFSTPKRLLKNINTVTILRPDDPLYQPLYDLEVASNDLNWSMDGKGRHYIRGPYSGGRQAACLRKNDGQWEFAPKDAVNQRFDVGLIRSASSPLINKNLDDPIITDRFSAPFQNVRFGDVILKLDVSAKNDPESFLWVFDPETQNLIWFGQYQKSVGWNN